MKRNLQKRKLRNRSSISNSTRPRLIVYRSNAHIFAQIVSLDGGKILASANDKNIKAAKMNKTQLAEKVGEALAAKALKANVKEVVFDRSGYKYHGRVKALAEAARKGGLIF